MHQESTPIAPFYGLTWCQLSKRGGRWIVVDNERFPYAQGFQAGLRHVRCLSLWCRALKPAIESYAKTLEAVITNILSARRSERQARLSGSDLPGFFDKEKLEDNL